VKQVTSHSQRAQTQSRAAHKPQPISLSERLALSPREFAAALGKSATFAYRQIYAGRIKPISDCGRMMISRSEIDHFLARAAEYNPSRKQKPEMKKEGQREQAV
jgi:Helix-turn-helix domain